MKARGVRYFEHLVFEGWFGRNPLHDGARQTWEESPQGDAILAALGARRVALGRFLDAARGMVRKSYRAGSGGRNHPNAHSELFDQRPG